MMRNIYTLYIVFFGMLNTFWVYKYMYMILPIDPCKSNPRMFKKFNTVHLADAMVSSQRGAYELCSLRRRARKQSRSGEPCTLSSHNKVCWGWNLALSLQFLVIISPLVVDGTLRPNKGGGRYYDTFRPPAAAL